MKGQNGILHMAFSFSNTSTNLKLSPISLANTLTPYYLSNFISHSPFMNLHTPVLIDLLIHLPNTKGISVLGSLQEPLFPPGVTPLFVSLVNSAPRDSQ